MAFCKICVCGEKIVFARRLGFPPVCPKCGRELVDRMTYDENDPRVQQLIDERKTGGAEPAPAPVQPPQSEGKKIFALRLDNGAEIDIPEGGCVIGRTETGAELLAEFVSVSRQHLRVTPRRKIGLIVEDLSTYGTFVDGKRVEKNMPVRVAEGARITLCNVDARVITKECAEA